MAENDLNEILNKQIISIICEKSKHFEGENIFDSIKIFFSDKIFEIKPIIDTDEIDYSISDSKISNRKSRSSVYMIDEFRDMKLMSIWKAYNSRGYFDNLILGFYQLHPSMSIISEGSSLKLFFIHDFFAKNILTNSSSTHGRVMN